MDESLSKRIALIVGTCEHQDAGLRQAVAPAEGAEALARALWDPKIGGFDVRTTVNQPSYQVGQRIESFFTDRKLRRIEKFLTSF